MKEYKVESWKVSLSKNNKNLENFLNEHARNGWKVIHIAEQSTRVVFERDKNR
ncbi:conserved protein of unknown function [Tenacibaculum sp. 190130A14a]|uniref:DUF4177 domain-containing protein n=1 Tax=Tenacibaculum polynesiense TaxID=3137857 RepID=A0ABM9P751_9FLAO